MFSGNFILVQIGFFISKFNIDRNVVNKARKTGKSAVAPNLKRSNASVLIKLFSEGKKEKKKDSLHS